MQTTLQANAGLESSRISHAYVASQIVDVSVLSSLLRSTLYLCNVLSDGDLFSSCPQPLGKSAVGSLAFTVYSQPKHKLLEL